MSGNHRHRAGTIAALASLLAPGAAHAHLVSTRFGELYSGVLHPLTTLTHLLPWLALGLLAAWQPRDTGRWVLLAFPIAVAAGLATAALWPQAQGTDTLNAASLPALGLLVALALRLPGPALITLTVLLGLSHGHANSAPGLEGAAWLLYVSGVALTAYILLTLASAGAVALASGPAWGRIAVRATGSWIAAAGLMYLGFLWLAA